MEEIPQDQLPKKSKKKFFIIFAILLILSALGAGVYLILARQTFIKTLPWTNITATVEKGDIKTQLLFPGSIDFDSRALLEFQQLPTAGTKIAYIGVKVGDSVKRGQLIASLDPAPFLKQQQKNLAAYLKQRAIYDQTVTNNVNTPVTDQVTHSIQQSQSDLSSSIYDVELQDQSINFANITSPIDGLVTRVDAPVVGINIVTADEAKFEVIDPKTFFFSVDMDESEVVNLHTGDKGVLSLNAYPNNYMEGIISNISFAPRQDSNGNTVYKVKFSIPGKSNGNYFFRLGMTGNVIFYSWAQNVLTIPKQVIHDDDFGSFVKVGKDKKVTYIQTGISDGKNVEVVRGLFEGEYISY